MNTVDVIIPCYNYGRYLRECVHSVVCQTGVGVRVLVIDDASSDETPEIGWQLAGSHGAVQFRRHAVNRGHIATYNEGLLEWASGEYVVLLSADDMLAPGSLGRAVRILNQNPNVGMVYGRTIHFRESSEIPRVNGATLAYRRFRGVEWLEGRCRAGHNVITSPEVVVRRSIQRAVGGYRAELPHAGDLEMWLRIAAISDIAYVLRTPQAFYRVHQQSMTTQRNSFVDIYQRKAAFDAFVQHHPDATLAARLHELASRALAGEALWRSCRAYDHDQVEERRADALVQFAMETYPGAASLPEYRALCRRRRLGPTICHRTQLFAASALARRASIWLKKERWKRRGV